jgi:Integrase core domain
VALPDVTARRERYEVAAFIRDARSVTSDAQVEHQMLNAMLAHTRGAADRFLAALRSRVSLNREARAWERIYNTVRPHQALGYLTPLEFLRGARREADASRPNRPLRARAPGSRVAPGDECSEPALDAAAPARHNPKIPNVSPMYRTSTFTSFFRARGVRCDAMSQPLTALPPAQLES